MIDDEFFCLKSIYETLYELRIIIKREVIKAAAIYKNKEGSSN